MLFEADNLLSRLGAHVEYQCAAVHHVIVCDLDSIAGLAVEGDALQLIGRKAQGSMRDAQSILDQVIAFRVLDIAVLLGLEVADSATAQLLFKTNSIVMVELAAFWREPWDEGRYFIGNVGDRDSLQSGILVAGLVDALFILPYIGGGWVVANGVVHDNLARHGVTMNNDNGATIILETNIDAIVVFDTREPTVGWFSLGDTLLELFWLINP